MNRIEATELAKQGKSIELASRDATGSCFTRFAVWLGDDGHLVMAHPTQDRGTTLVLDCQIASLGLAR